MKGLSSPRSCWDAGGLRQGEGETEPSMGRRCDSSVSPEEGTQRAGWGGRARSSSGVRRAWPSPHAQLLRLSYRLLCFPAATQLSSNSASLLSPLCILPWLPQGSPNDMGGPLPYSPGALCSRDTQLLEPTEGPLGSLSRPLLNPFS